MPLLLLSCCARARLQSCSLRPRCAQPAHCTCMEFSECLFHFNSVTYMLCTCIPSTGKAILHAKTVSAIFSTFVGVRVAGNRWEVLHTIRFGWRSCIFHLGNRFLQMSLPTEVSTRFHPEMTYCSSRIEIVNCEFVGGHKDITYRRQKSLLR